MSVPLRDIIVFVIAMVVTGWVGVWLNAVTQPAVPTEGLGTLIWLLGPVVAAFIIAVRRGDWVNALGLKLNWSAKWYVVGVVATPLIMVIVLPLALITGAVSFGTQTVSGALGLAGVFLVSSAIKNVFEELCWRGFLTPWFEKTRFTGLANHLITGVIWAVWHIPYWLFFVSRTESFSFSGLPLLAFIFLAFIVLPLQAILHGELRLLTGSIWPAWALHTVSNVISMLLLTSGYVVINGSWGFVLSPGTAGLVYAVVLALVGLVIYRQRVGVA